MTVHPFHENFKGNKCYASITYLASIYVFMGWCLVKHSNNFTLMCTSNKYQTKNYIHYKEILKVPNRF